MATTTITVSTAAQLTAALSKATGGETILLAPGNYGKLSLTVQQKFDYTYDSKVTIRSADPDRPAVFNAMDIRNAENIAFENLTFDYVSKATDSTTASPFQISGSKNISISGSTFDGDVAKGGDAAGIGYATGRAFISSNNTNFDFIDNTVYNFWKGLGFAGNDNARIVGNEIYGMRSDGLNVGAPKGILIEDNYFHDFVRAPKTGDHADFIQFASTNATRPASDITIRGNLFDIGDGSNTQTIFMRNDQVDKGLAGSEMFFRNVLIENNTIYNDHLHGITVGETAGLTIRNNTVLHANGGDEGVTGTGEVPRINVATRSTDVTITGNIAGKIAGGLEGYNGLPADWAIKNNLLVQDTNATAENHYSTLFIATTYDNGASGGEGGRHYIALPGGLIEAMGAGSTATHLDRAPEALTPRFHVGSHPLNDAALVFDAANFSFGQDGSLAQAGAKFLWTFGDGTTAQGGLVSHSYAAAGSYAVKLEVVMPDGSRASVTDRVQNLGTDLLRFDTRSGDFLTSDGLTDRISDIASGALAGKPKAYALDTDVNAKAVVEAKDIAGLFGADNFTLNMQIKADATADSSGNVFRLQNAITGNVDSAGNFVFILNTDEVAKTTLTSKGVSLLDGKAHAVSVIYDADQGLLSLSVDGKAAATVEVTGHIPAMGFWNLAFGSPPVGAAFDGKVLSFDLAVDRSNYTTYDPDAFTLAGKGMTVTTAETEADATPAVVLDDYVLDSAAMAGLAAGKLRGETHLVQDEDGANLLSFDGSGGRAVLGKLTQFAEAENLAVAVDFQRDQATGNGILVGNSGQFTLNLEGDGFRISVATADEGMKVYRVGDLGIADTLRHEAVVIVDAVDDRLQVFVDNRLVFEDDTTDLAMTNPAGGGEGWMLGRNFDGQIADFRIDDDIGHLAARDGMALFA